MASENDKKPSNKEVTKEGECRATFIVNEEMLEILKALAYWERRQIKDMLKQALENYIDNWNYLEVIDALTNYRQRNEQE